MLIRHHREKLINAIIYFASNTRYLGKTKLCKLLYFLDFGHYKETGRSVTELDYSAWPMGPVPVTLYAEIDSPEPDLAERVEFKEVPIRKGTMLTVTPKASFDPSHFSRRELGLLEELAKEFKDALAEDMVEATHLENQPWHKIYVEKRLKQATIPYDLALLKQEAEQMREEITEREELVKHFSK